MTDPVAAYLTAYLAAKTPETPETAHAACRYIAASFRAQIAQERARMAAKPDTRALRSWLAAWAVAVVAVSIGFWIGRLTS
jgi:hypothetical protein